MSHPKKKRERWIVKWSFQGDRGEYRRSFSLQQKKMIFSRSTRSHFQKKLLQ